MRESVLEKQCIAYAEERDWIYRKIRWIGRRGAPDRLFARRGQIIFVEFKQQKRKKLTAQQKREHERLFEAGVEVYVIYDFEDFKIIFS